MELALIILNYIDTIIKFSDKSELKTVANYFLYLFSLSISKWVCGVIGEATWFP